MQNQKGKTNQRFPFLFDSYVNSIKPLNTFFLELLTGR